MMKCTKLSSSRPSGNGTKLTVGAYRYGMVSICMLMSTEHHENHWDIVPRTLSDLILHKNDRPSLHKKGFFTSNQIEHENEHINDNLDSN